MNNRQAGRHAFLLHGRHIGFGHFGIAAFSDKVSQRRIIDRRLGSQRMACGNGNIGCADKGIRAGGVDGDLLFAVSHIEGDFDTFRAANPVALHGFDLLRPLFQRIQVVQQLFRIIGDFDKPLRDLFTLNFGVAAPAAAVDHLLVRQHRLIVRAPVHGRGLFIDQAFFIQFGKEPLFPAIVLWLAGCQFTTPVIAKAQQFELVFHVGDVVVSPRGRSGVVFHRSAFRRQAESIPANRL